MIKKRQKGIVVLLVICILITAAISFGGCQSKETPKPETTGESKDATQAPAEPTPAPTPEPVVLKMFAPAFESTFAAGFQDDPVMKEIEKLTGVKLDITPANAIADVKAKLTAMMASRELPDLVYVEDNNIKKQMVTSKLALNLDPYIDKLSNFEKNKPNSTKLMRQRFSLDVDNKPVDGLYFVALGGTLGNPYRPTAGFYVRWDLYKALGSPKIESYDDYIPLVKQMLALEPKNKDGKQNYGVSAWFGQGAAFGIWPIANPFYFDTGIMITPSNEFDFDTDDTKPSLTSPDSLYWTAVEWWNKAFRAGIIDPDAFVQKWPDYLEKIDGQNRAMLSFADFAIKGGEAAFATDGMTDKGYVALPSTRTDRKTFVTAVYEPVGNRHFCISADTKNADKAVEFLNFLASWDSTMLMYNGVQGVHWDLVNGKPQLKPDVVTGLLEDKDYSLKTGVNKYHNIAGMGEVDVWPEYNVSAKLRYQPEVFSQLLSPVEKDACSFFNVQYPGQIVIAGKTNLFAGKGQRYLNYTSLPPLSQDFNEINTNLLKITMEDVFEAIMAKTEEDFKRIKGNIIDKAVKLGGDKLYEQRAKMFYEGK